ncbi:TolC family protein [Tenacibaculum sp. UWU-22]|uniref:TolC family protein n=1 Tax=Tenacibaculum sp. UWU-22 TaxID=3234187 RepID=UPI0034DB553E
MKNKYLLITITFLYYSFIASAQNGKSLSLTEAIKIGLKQSDVSKIIKSKVTIAENALAVTKNTVYPTAKISGEYMFLNQPTINSPLLNNANNSNNTQPSVNQILLGQASVSMPVFVGFKIKNLVKESQNNLEATKENAKNDKEELAFQIITEYVNLYKATETVGLIKENLKSAQQRVTDFLSKEQNGLLAKNDLLKAKLQASTIEVSLEKAENNRANLNYQLAILLKLPETTNINTTLSVFTKLPTITSSKDITRGDLEALRYQKKAAKNELKVAKSNYYPSLSISAGYIALDAKNALTVTNAMNVGLGVSYDLSDIFKNKKAVNLAKSKIEVIDYTINNNINQIKIEIDKAIKAYNLAIKTKQVYLKSVEQATENYRIVKDKFNNGLLDTNDLLDADVEQLQAKINVAYANANIVESYYNILKAEGKLTTNIL